MSKYYAVYFVGDNKANNRVRIESSRTSNRGAFLDLFAALAQTGLMLLFTDKHKADSSEKPKNRNYRGKKFVFKGDQDDETQRSKWCYN